MPYPYFNFFAAPSGIRTKNFTPKTLTAFPLPQPEKAPDSAVSTTIQHSCRTSVL